MCLFVHAYVFRVSIAWESEASKSSGIVRYVGRIDSEYVDNRLYVGLQLDNPGELVQHKPSL